MKISLFVPCYVDQMSPHIAVAMMQVIERLGHTVDYPEQQTCCGQPAFNCGYHNDARGVAEHFLKCFGNSEVIAVPSGSCAAMVKVFYRELFADTPLQQTAADVAERTFEFSQLLVDRLDVTDVGAKFSATATYHDGCHGLRELGLKQPPRTLLENVEGLRLIEMDEAESCCGFGGTFSVKFPQVSTAMAEVKAGSIDATSADVVVSGDPSCLMQIDGYLKRQGKPTRCLHLAEVLASQ